MEYEAEEISKLIPSKTHLVILTPESKQFDSQKFAYFISKYSHITFVIGGAFGIDKTLKEKADLLLSLSDLTFPHKLARIILVEQLYRAYTILNNHPYDK
jgi:23S rRNA (pseudouridine1915-N3)-methyltransferase